MSRNKILFFDLDDTLYRRSMPFGEACRVFFGETVTVNGEEQPLSEAVINRTYQTTQIRCEEAYFPTRRGEITKDEGYIHRFRKGFEDVGIIISAEEALRFKDAYQEAQKHIQADPVILELLPQCAKRYEKIGVISNGGGKQQRAKLEAMDLYEWIDPELVVISEEAGVDKPAEGIFRYAEKLAGAGRENMVYVGDSAVNDVEAAKAAGWHAVLWNWEDTDHSIREISGRDVSSR